MLPLTRSTCAAALLGALSAWGAAPMGRIVLLHGDVLIEAADGRRTAAAGAAPIALAGVRTGADGRVQIVMADGVQIALAPKSELRWSASEPNTVTLNAGGLRIDATPQPAGWRVELADRSILTNAYLELLPCAAGCSQPPGLYGRVALGDAVLEYQGGRSVVRNHAFRWTAATERPQTLASLPLVIDDADDLDAAQRARVAGNEALRDALQAFNAGDDEAAKQRLQAVRELLPGEATVDYYLGLIALRQKDNAEALRRLQAYAAADPEGAAARDVPKTLTLLSSNELQQEAASAVAHESELTKTPPEPGSIAVQAFVDQGDPAYRPLAKGIAAMIIADLSKVPGLKVLEREKVQLLIDEMKIGDAGLADPKEAVRSGRLMRAEKVVVGTFEVQ